MANGQFFPQGTPVDSTTSFPREPGDIQTAVIALVDRLAPVVPVSEQPALAREIAEVIASKPSLMGNNMFVRQSLIRRGTASPDQVIEGLAAWVTVVFDLGNLQRDRQRALPTGAILPDADVDRLSQALAASSNGCILAVPHSGCLELFATHLVDRGFDLSFVYTIGTHPTPTEEWISRGRHASLAKGIPFGRRNTGSAISEALQKKGIVLKVVDVYPSEKFEGVQVSKFDGHFNYPPGPARFARAGTPVLPCFASRRTEKGFAMSILAPVEFPAGLPAGPAGMDFTQRLANSIEGLTEAEPDAYWLWHPIPNDPYLAMARRQRPDLLSALQPPDDETVAQAVEALGRKLAT